MTSESTEPTISEAESTRGVLSGWVDQRASTLQSRYLQDDAKAVATLAQLRRAVAGDGRLNPEVWNVFDGMPEQLIRGEEDPSYAENAAIHALNLFAIHQQSRRDKGMHRLGYAHSVGQAAATLNGDATSNGVADRFRAITRVQSLTSMLPHLRALINQLRAQRIPLDYAALAEDFYDIQFPGGLDKVRIRWMRAFHGPVRQTSASSMPDTETTTFTDSGDDA